MVDGDIARHPWNRGFAWVDHRASASVLTDEQVSAFDEIGGVAVEGLVTGDRLAAVVAECDRLEAESEAWLREQDDERFFIGEAGAITFSAHLVARSDVLRALSADDAILGLCLDLVGDDVDLYWDQAVYKKPEKPRRFPWHQDNGYAFVEPQQYLTIWLALTDATAANGCPWVAPGLHRHGTLRHRYVDPLGWECLDEPADAGVAVPVAAGGAVVFSSLTPHLTGPNTTATVRKAYILQYAPARAAVLHGRPHGGAPDRREPCGNDEWQYPVLRRGRPCPR